MTLNAASRVNTAADPRGTPPKVSILLPNLNNRPFLDERMRSIQGQTFSDWELVVVDSYSDDGAWEFFQEWAGRDKRIRLFQSRLRGIYPNWNRCLELAQGEYVLIAPSDDTMERNFLEYMVRALDENSDCDLAHCKLRIIDENGGPSRALSWEQLFSTKYFGEWIDRPHIRRAPHDGILYCGVRTVYTSITQLLIRRRLFDRIGMFSTRFGPAADFEWGMRASLLASTVHVPHYLAAWRVHQGQNTDISKLDAASRKRLFIKMVRHAFLAARRIDPRLLNKMRLNDLTVLYRKERLVATIREARRHFAPRPIPRLMKIGIGLRSLFRDPLVFLEFLRRQMDAKEFLSPLAPLHHAVAMVRKYGLADCLRAAPLDGPRKLSTARDGWNRGGSFLEAKAGSRDEETMDLRLNEALKALEKFPPDWHKAGTMYPALLRRIVERCRELDVKHSMETGSGLSTIVFSLLSADHKVFAVDCGGSVTHVRQSPWLKSATVEFILGPTQLTLPRYVFHQPLQLALIDGPHGYPFPDLEYFYIYPHLEENSLLIVDDIHIPTIHNMFRFLREDDMFDLLEVFHHTAFFRRTAAPTFPPTRDGWWLQNFNKSVKR